MALEIGNPQAVRCRRPEVPFDEIRRPLETLVGGVRRSDLPTNVPEFVPNAAQLRPGFVPSSSGLVPVEATSWLRDLWPEMADRAADATR